MRASAPGGSGFIERAIPRYALAVVCTAAALLVRKLLEPVLGTSVPYITLFPAVACVAIFAGDGPAALTALLGLLGAAYWFVPPAGLAMMGTAERLAAGLYLFFCGFIIWMCHVNRGYSDKVRRLQGEKEEQMASELEVMRRLQETGTLCIRPENELEACLDSILEAAISLTGAQKGNLQLLDPVTGALKIAAQRGFEQPFLEFFESVTNGTPATCSRALREHRRIVVEDVTTSEIFVGSLNVMLQAGIRAVQSTPLTSSSGTILGVISTHFAEPHRLSEREARLIDLLSRQAGDYLERKQAERELRAASAQVQQLLEAVPTGITHCSCDLRYLAANPAYAQLAGRPAEEIVGRPIVEVMGEAGWKMIEPYVQRVLQGERVEYQTPLPFTGGGRRQIHVVYTPERDSNGQVIGWFASVQDISAFKAVEEQLRRAEKLAAAGQLAASLAHEINNPLESVINALYLLESDRELSPGARDMVRIASQETSRLTRIVRQSLSYYRVGVVAKAFDLGLLVRESLEILRDKAQRNGIELRSKLGGANPMMGYPDEVRQVIDNLLINAIEAMPKGGSITVSARRCRSWGREESHGTRLTIADTGTGIAKENFARVFEAFFTTKSDKGTGLGLWAVRGIVAKHNGEMRIRSTDSPGRSGTVVSIFWPDAQAGQSSPLLEAVATLKRMAG